MKSITYLLILLSLIIFSCENPTTSKDCAGVTGGTAELDNCDTCDSDTTNDCVVDCAGVWGGDSVEDECENCNGDCEEIDGIITCSENELNVIHPDCFGVCGGEYVDDECGICGGDNSSCLDCDGQVNGNAELDSEGNCCVAADLDECGVCNGDGSSCIGN